MDPENSEDSGSDVIPEEEEEEEEETHEIGGLINSDGEVDFPDLSGKKNWEREKDKKKKKNKTTHKKNKTLFMLSCILVL